MDELDTCIAGLYRAATGEEPWSKALQRVTNAIDGMGTQFVSIGGGGGALTLSRACESSPPDAELEYVQTYHRLDPRIPHLLAAPPGHWLYCQDLFADSESEEQPYYRDLLIPYGARYSATMKVTEGDGETVLIALLSKRSRGRFDERQKNAVERLGGHLVEAISRFRRARVLATGSVVGTALIQRIGRPVFLIDAERNITMANRDAEMLLDADDSPLRRRADHLQATEPELDRLLTSEAAALASNEQSDSDRFLALPERWKSRFLGIATSRLLPDRTMRVFGHIGQLMITVHPRKATGVAPMALWQAAFALTRAEARLAAEVWSGHTIRDASKTLGIAESTARSQLIALFRKTETARQPELIQALSALGVERH